MCSGSAATTAHVARSARRVTTRATCRWAAPGVPPGRMNESSVASPSLNSSHQPSSRSTCASVTRSGGYSGSSTTGVARSAPTSNRSFWIWRSGATMRSGRSPTARATPMAALASSESA